MKLHVLAVGSSKGKDLTQFTSDPDFRKATRNMVMSYAALQPILTAFPKLPRSAFVLGSSYGELEVTKNFLITLANQGLARPLLFQSSLHNATLGFLALKLKATGPSMTVSNRHFTGESCIEAASLLIEAGSPYCVVIGVDMREPQLAPGISRNYPPQVTLDEGAGALLLASEESARSLGARSLAVIESIDCRSTGGEPVSGPYYDSCSLELLGNAITGSSVPSEVRLSKPDGGVSIIRLS